jgi:hypothetical protein
MAEKAHERSDAGIASSRFNRSALGTVADHEQGHRTAGFLRAERANERLQVRHGVESSDGADDDGAGVDAELAAYASARGRVGQRADVDAVVNDVDSVGGEPFGNQMLLQLRRHGDDGPGRVREDAIRRPPLR